MRYMSIKLMFKTSTSSGEETKSLAAQIGQHLRGGEIFVLKGDLGFGKTEFVKGLVRGAGISEEVTSPSFTISNVYQGEQLTIHHMDYYRISSAGVLRDELQELFEDKKNVIVIEWPDVLKDAIPESSIDIKIFNKGENNRDFEINYPEQYKYLFEDIPK